jgi:hypothetical protein
MKEYNLKEVDSTSAGNLPVLVGMWSKVKHFLLKEIDLDRPIVIELTEKQAKVLREVHDFWFQEIEFPELHDFFFKDINLFAKKNK